MTDLAQAMHPAVTRVPVYKHNTRVKTEDYVAEEVPIALVYNGISHTVMMGLPLMLEAFGVGFSLSEGIVRDRSDIYDVEVVEACGLGREVRLTISSEAFLHFKARRRAMLGRTGCGICGIESLNDAIRPVPVLKQTQNFDKRNYQGLMAQLGHFQKIGALTGCTHAAVWVSPDGIPLSGTEDVGRHVALDKLLGMRALEGWHDGALIVSSRASYEMVQKAAMCGVEIMFAVSAPTALAVRTAQRCGITLVAFARDKGFNVYTHPERLIE